MYIFTSTDEHIREKDVWLKKLMEEKFNNH